MEFKPHTERCVRCGQAFINFDRWRVFVGSPLCEACAKNFGLYIRRDPILMTKEEDVLFRRHLQAFQGGEYRDKPLLPHLFSRKPGTEETPSMDLSITKKGRVAGTVWLEKEIKKRSRKRKTRSTTL